MKTGSSGLEDGVLEEVDQPAQAVVFTSAARTGQPLCDT
jgi:hypothetical protein